MYCIHCGKQVTDNSKFCPYCGGALPQEVKKPAQSAPTPVQKNNLLAIIGFILSFVEGVAGLICSIIAYKKADKDFNGDKKNFALVGIIISSVSIVSEILAAIFFCIYGYLFFYEMMMFLMTMPIGAI